MINFENVFETIFENIDFDKLEAMLVSPSPSTKGKRLTDKLCSLNEEQLEAYFEEVGRDGRAEIIEYMTGIDLCQLNAEEIAWVEEQFSALAIRIEKEPAILQPQPIRCSCCGTIVAERLPGGSLKITQRHHGQKHTTIISEFVLD
jgi:hypothetical protein